MNKKQTEGELLKHRLKHQGYSLKEISDKAGMSYSTVAQQLGGYTKLSDHLRKTCERMIKQRERIPQS